MSEGQALAEQIAAEIAALSWEELDSHGGRNESHTAPSGRRFNVRSRATWDMDEWASGMNISVQVHPTHGLRRLWSYKAWRTRGGPDDPVPPRPSG
jgi:hypothetical protein